MAIPTSMDKAMPSTEANIANALTASVGSVIDNGTLNGASPGFVSEAAQDYHLAAGSPCIDTGAALHPDVLPAFNVTMEYVKHQSGTPRPVSGPLDIGAYEFTP